MYFSLFELSVVLASQMGKELHFCSTTEDWVSRKMWKGKGEENNWVAQTSSQGAQRTTEDGIVVLSWNLGYCSGLEVGAVCCIWTNYREYVQKNLHWCFHTWKLVHLAVLSLRYIFFLTWYLDLSESVHWRTSLGRACGPQSLSTLKEEIVKCMDGLGKWRDCCSSTTSCRDLSRADKCPGSVGYIHLQGQASHKVAVGMMLHCSKSGMTSLSLKTNTSWSRSQSERVWPSATFCLWVMLLPLQWRCIWKSLAFLQSLLHFYVLFSHFHYFKLHFSLSIQDLS